MDIAIVETGLGGRLDATNVLQPLVSVITTIGLEHTQILGTSIEEIAFEKGGIIKKGIPCITGVKSKKVIRDFTRNLCSKEIAIDSNSSQRDSYENSSLNGLMLDFLVAGNYLKNVQVSLVGEHQAMNALLAVNSAEVADPAKRFQN